MSISCQFSQTCNNEVSHECLLDNKLTYLCYSDLLKVLSSGHLAKSVKSVNLIFPDENKYLLINALSKKLKEVTNIKNNFLQTTATAIKKLVKISEESLSNFNSLIKDLSKAIELIVSVKSAKTFEKIPIITSLILLEKETIFEKLESLSLFDITFKDINGLKIPNIVNNLKGAIDITPVIIDGLCSNGHKLRLSIDTEEYYTFLINSQTGLRCDLCKTALNNDALHCRKCGFDLCDNCCEAKDYKKISIPKCDYGHPCELLLDVNQYFCGVICDICGDEINKNSWRCKPCSFDICEICSKEKGIQPRFEYPLKCKRKHRMILSIDENIFFCDMCKGENVIGNHWKCDSCKVKYCKGCAEDLGHKTPLCSKLHEMIQSSEKKKSFFKIGSKKCFKCNGAVGDFGFSCKLCDSNLCENCFLEYPNSYYVKVR